MSIWVAPTLDHSVALTGFEPLFPGSPENVSVDMLTVALIGPFGRSRAASVHRGPKGVHDGSSFSRVSGLGVAWMAATVNVPSAPAGRRRSPSWFDISPPDARFACAAATIPLRFRPSCSTTMNPRITVAIAALYAATGNGPYRAPDSHSDPGAILTRSHRFKQPLTDAPGF